MDTAVMAILSAFNLIKNLFDYLRYLSLNIFFGNQIKFIQTTKNADCV